MDDFRKTKQQLVAELEALRAQVKQLQSPPTAVQSSEMRPREAPVGMEARQNAATLGERERSYRHMVEHSLGLICIHDFDGNLLYVNPAAARALGYAPHELAGKNLQDVLSPPARLFFPHYLERIRHEPTDQGLMQVVTKSGELRAWRYHNSWYEENRQPLYVVGCAQDVTEQVRLENALRRSEARYARATEAGKVWVWDWNLKTKKVHIDPYLLSHLGLTEHELREHPEQWDSCMPEEDARVAAAAQEAYFSGQTPHYEVEHRLIHKDGSMRWYLCRATVERDESGIPLRMIGTDTDITERKAMEEELRQAREKLELRVQARTAELARANDALRESEERYRGIFENANDIIATFTPEGVITRVNRAAEIILGWSREELIGQNYRRFVTEASVAIAEERIRLFLHGEKLKENMEIEIFRKGGGTILFECRARPIFSRDGTLMGFQIVYRDITARRQAEEQLRRAKEMAEAADREKSEFLATMSHELRTPLNVILGYVELLLDQEYEVSDEDQREFIRQLGKSAHGLFDLINSVLDFNRLEAGRMPMERTPVQLASLLKEIEGETQGLRGLTRLTYCWRVEEGLPVLMTDAGKLKVIIKNLLGNAIKFTKTGGVTVSAYQNNGGVAISVTDTGAGIPPDQQALIFQAFRKANGASEERSDGFGLGLHIVNKLLTLLGGAIEVESSLGQGSTFRVWLPLAAQVSSCQ